MGRHSILPEDRDAVTPRLYLKSIPINSDGYDPNGTYFGNNRQTLYWCADIDLSIDFTLWARSRTHAKEVARYLLPNARFRR